MALDNRLSLVASYVRPGSRLADIGTDHARLPAALVAAGICPSAVASDLRAGPVEAARRTVSACGLEKQISIRLGDGLSPLSPGEADDIVIAGMGGETIAAILQNAPWVKDSHYHFILQPMTRAEVLHRFLLQHGFSILQEKAAVDGKRLYVVLLAQFTGAPPISPDDPRIWIGGLSPSGDDKRYLEKQRRALLQRIRGLRSRQAISPEEEAEADLLEKAVSALLTYEEEQV